MPRSRTSLSEFKFVPTESMSIKCSTSSLLILFIGWCISSAFLFLVLIEVDPVDSNLPKFVVSGSKIGKEFVSNNLYILASGLNYSNVNGGDTGKVSSFSHDIAPNTLPSKHETTLQSPAIYLSWPIDDRLFTVENFKSLETILTLYPNSEFRILVSAPHDHYLHKAGNMLSVTAFQKYSKRGYNIQVVAASKMAVGLKFAPKYWNQYVNSCCMKCNKDCRSSDHVQPYHIQMFIILVKLYRKGGIFMDFSFLFLKQIEDSVQNGYFIETVCSDKRDMELWRKHELKSIYNTQIYKEQTLKSDAEDLFQQLFNGTECVTSAMLVFRAPQNRIVECVLVAYDDPVFRECIDSSVDGGASCIRSKFSSCFQEANARNELVTDRIPHHQMISNPTPHSLVSLNETVIETFNRYGNIMQLMQTPNQAYQISSENVQVLWMGSYAFQGHWHAYPYPIGSMMSLITTEYIDLSKRSVGELDPQCQVNRCSPYSRDVMGLFGEKFNRSTFMSTYSGREESTCAPSVVIPGFYKSASSFIFSAIAQHPQVIQPLVGAQMKETNCYMGSTPKKLKNRIFCFPYIEPTENFITLDGTVYYATDWSTPATFLKDNPNIKVIFSIRHPVDRLYSNYKFALETFRKFGPFDPFVSIAFNRNHKFGRIRDLLTNYTREAIGGNHSAGKHGGSEPQFTNEYNRAVQQLLKEIQQIKEKEGVRLDRVLDPKDELHVEMSTHKLKDMHRGTSASQRSDGPIALKGEHVNETSNESVSFLVHALNTSVYDDQQLDGVDGIELKQPQFREHTEHTLDGTENKEEEGDTKDLIDYLISPDNHLIQELMNVYFKDGYEGKHGTLSTIVIHSIQFIGILQYMSVVGKENVMIVRDEDLDVRDRQRFQATMDKIYDFIGLCSSNNPKNTKPTLKGKAVITPFENDMSREMYSRLSTFYRPFTSILDNILMCSEVFHYKRRLKQQELLNRGHNDGGPVRKSKIASIKHLDLIHFNNISHWIDRPPSKSLHTIESVLSNHSVPVAYRSDLHELFKQPTWFELEDILYAQYTQVERATSWKAILGNYPYLAAALNRVGVGNAPNSKSERSSRTGSAAGPGIVNNLLQRG